MSSSSCSVRNSGGSQWKFHAWRRRESIAKGTLIALRVLGALMAPCK